MTPRLNHYLICNPENRRVRYFQQALVDQGWPIAKEVAYEHFNADEFRRQLSEDGERKDLVWIRIESPGENVETEKRLVGIGHSVHSPSDGFQAVPVDQFEEDRGRVRYSRKFYLGFCHVLDNLREVADQAGLRFYLPPEDIKLMFDKTATINQLAKYQIPVPCVIEPVPATYDELLLAMRERSWRRVFVKLRYGSSASGVIALSVNNDQEAKVITTLEMVHSVDVGGLLKFYNNLKVRTYSERNDVAALVNFVLGEGAHVEKWLPKAGMDGRVMDFRVVVVGGRACQIVARTSPGPITNLHLGNQRGDLDRIRDCFSPREWSRMIECCENVAIAFPDSLYFGVDVLVGPGFRNPIVLEVNAFGDLLPGAMFNGKSSYDLEVEAMSQIVGRE